MKKMLIIVVAGLFILACNNEKEKEAKSGMVPSDLVQSSLKGDIAMIEETPYKVDSTGAMGAVDSCCISIEEYDENGNQIKFISKTSNGNISSEGVMTRHPNGTWKGMSSSKDGKVTNSMETTMDDNGVYTSAVAKDSAGNLDVYYTDLSQTDFGGVTGWKQYDKDSVFRMTGEAKYDKYNLIESTTKDSVGVVKSSSKSMYNDKGEMTESSFTNVGKDSTTTRVTKYTYESHDDMGNWTQRTTWDDKGKATKIVKRTYTYRKADEVKK